MNQTQQTTEQAFWAREFARLAIEQAMKKGVQRHTMAQAMLVQAWMLLTEQTEENAVKAVKGLYASSVARQFMQPSDGNDTTGLPKD